MRRPWLWLLLALIAFGAIHSWHRLAEHPAAGILAPDPPRQTAPAPGDPAQIRNGRFTLTPRADFHVVARVLSRDDYHFDAGAALVPTDLALGWGRMSDSAVLSHIRVSQSSRFYFWSVRRFPIPRREIETHSANMHLIPGSRAVARAIDHVRVGEVVDFDGYLVDASAPGGWRWRTSMTRNDTGPGACELVWVKSLRIEQPSR